MKTCLLVLLLLLGVCGPSSQACGGSEPDKYIDATPFRTITKWTLDGCQKACTDDAKCEYFAYFAQHNLCQLQSKPYWQTLAVPGVISGYPLRDCQPPPVPAPDCTKLYLDTNMWNRPFETLTDIPSAEACRQKCDDDSRCDFFVYFGQNWKGDFRKLYCFLKSGTPKKIEPYPTMTSGYAARSCN